MALFRFESGPRTGELIPLDRNKVTFGRSKTCDCVLPHPTVSREHFYVEHNNGKLFLVDQGSENGTFSNSERVSWIELKQGDEIQAGPFILVFEIAEGARRFEEQQADGSPAAKHESARQTPRESSTMRLYPPEYLEGIEHFNAGRYFDAHEVWEEVWLRSTGDTRLFYQMLIQAAVGLHHYERGNSRGARGMHSNVIDKLSRLPSILMSLDLIDFQRQFKAFLAELMENNNEARPSSDIPGPQIRLRDRDAADWSL